VFRQQFISALAKRVSNLEGNK